MQLSLPEDLSPTLRQILEENRAIVEATIKPYVEIKLKPHRGLSLWQSKVGGVPYLPRTIDYPRDPDGVPLQLLTQINFEEVPKLSGFPQTGILQFYISADDDLYGASFESPTEQAKFRVLYFDQIDKTQDHLISDFSFLPEFENGPIYKGSAQLEFELKSAPISQSDYQFDRVLGDRFSAFDDELIDELNEEYQDYISDGSGHRIGGYPYFTQTDPRSYGGYQNYVLLLQLDSDEVERQSNAETGIDLMWGDSGIGNFFIAEEALKRLDFSEVLYNWDCC